MSDQVTVRVQIRGKWEYIADVEMDRAEFDRLDKMLDEGGREFRRAVNEISGLYFDARDAEFEDADDLDDFRIVEPDPTP